MVSVTECSITVSWVFWLIMGCAFCLAATTSRTPAPGSAGPPARRGCACSWKLPPSPRGFPRVRPDPTPDGASARFDREVTLGDLPPSLHSTRERSTLAEDFDPGLPGVRRGDVRPKGVRMATEDPRASQHAVDTADLAKFGYKQELKRALGTFSSFAVAFSYISPSTGIFTLFFLGMAALGGFLWWTLARGGARAVHRRPQLRRALEPLPGRRLGLPVDEVSGRADLRVVHRLDLSVRGHPDGGVGVRDAADRAAAGAQQDVRLELNTNLGSADQKVIARHHARLITVLNIYGVKLVAIVNNTGVIFEILGMVVFAVFLAIVHNNQGLGVIVDSKTGNIFEFPAPVTLSFLVAMFM